MKRTFALAALLAVVAFNSSHAQTLLTVGDDVTTVGRFDSTYRKNVFKGTPDFSEKALRDYMDLYTKFRLKVVEARRQHLDTTASVRNELQTYRQQLAKSYLVDKDKLDELMHEAYERSKTDVHVEHILVRVSPDARVEDTVKAWKKINDILARLKKGEDFEKLARDVSEDPSVKDNAGDLGWITVLQVRYAFENVAYNTKPGALSAPFRTKYGYHIVKVLERRASPGEVTVAHIFSKISHNATDPDRVKAREKIEALYAKLKAGEKFEDLAKNASDDKSSNELGGKLPPFGTGKMVESFEKAAFDLKNIGDYSAPVSTPYGWHIIKLLERKPIPSFDEMKDNLRRSIEKDDRYEEARKAFIAKTKKDYHFKEDAKAYKEFVSHVDSTIRTGMFTSDKFKDMNTALFTFEVLNADGKSIKANKSYGMYDFAQFMERNQRKTSAGAFSKDQAVNKLYNLFVDNACEDFKTTRLDYENASFREQMNEYRDGIMLFEITDRNVWTKAIKDTTGLKAFYETVKMKYMGNEKVTVKTYKFNDMKLAEKGKKLLDKGATDAELKEKLNKKDMPKNIVIEENILEKGQNKIVDSLEWKKGSYTLPQKDGSVNIVRIMDKVAPQPKPLEDVKGYVVSEYQEVLEKNWIQSLRDRYPVKVDEAVFKTLIK